MINDENFLYSLHSMHIKKLFDDTLIRIKDKDS